MDPVRLAPVRECMENYDIGDADEDWPNNVISTGTVAYSCGALYCPGGPKPVHDHDPDELRLCRELSDEATRLMDSLPVGMGSAASDGFQPFFVAASSEAECQEEITAELVRGVFGGSINPGASVIYEEKAFDRLPILGRCPSRCGLRQRRRAEPLPSAG